MNENSKYKQCILDMLVYVNSTQVLKMICTILQKHIQKGASDI